MLKQKNYPSVIYFDNPGYTDISHDMLSFGRDTQVLAMETDQFLYFGMYKPVNSVYLEMGSVVNAVTTSMVLEYHDGSSWVSVSNLIDDSKCFKRSGFIQFDKPTDWEKQTVNSVEKYFFRISVGSNLTAGTLVQGINIVFSEDRDLVGVYPSITNYLDGETSFILRHENSRDLIVQDLRNRGILKHSDTYSQLEPWDILEIDEVRLWSAYLTLANIFGGLQSKEGDFYKEKQEDFLKKAEFYKSAVYVALDRDDDGIKDASEQLGNIQTVRLRRG